ncbi:hypothetical protein QBC37DRAFT_79661 [Rhypophila decipiens]|uniref:Uncharacterized protein n=1 Tax=Rhypophila decipiens TaxID=261697 RepID=A0AAN7B380_9PEZI|nr:hypothetical protein QBC37DRAFT_79661 [Rhypophila decipiens]
MPSPGPRTTGRHCKGSIDKDSTLERGPSEALKVLGLGTMSEGAGARYQTVLRVLNQLWTDHGLASHQRRKDLLFLVQPVSRARNRPWTTVSPVQALALYDAAPPEHQSVQESAMDPHACRSRTWSNGVSLVPVRTESQHERYVSRGGQGRQRIEKASCTACGVPLIGPIYCTAPTGSASAEHGTANRNRKPTTCRHRDSTIVPLTQHH